MIIRTDRKRVLTKLKKDYSLDGEIVKYVRTGYKQYVYVLESNKPQSEIEEIVKNEIESWTPYHRRNKFIIATPTKIMHGYSLA